MVQLRRLLAALAQYASARLRLAVLEGREVGARVGKLLAIGAVTIVLLAGGWLFMAIAVALFLAERIGPVWAAAAIAGLHFVLAALLILRLKNDRGAFFPITTEELKKDRTWLEQQTEKKPG